MMGWPFAEAFDMGKKSVVQLILTGNSRLSGNTNVVYETDSDGMTQTCRGWRGFGFGDTNSPVKLMTLKQSPRTERPWSER